MFFGKIALFVVAVFLWACDNQPYNDGAILFRTAPESHTRAGIESNDDLREACSTGGEAIGIVGVVSNEYSSNVEIFSNERLYYSAGSWTYDNPRYWVWGAKHDFMAIYPYSSSGDYTYDSAAGVVEYPSLVLGESNNIDLMWSISSRDLSVDPDTSSPQQLDLHHALALLEFRFVNASSSVVSRVDNIALEGVKYKGSFSFTRSGETTLTVASDVVTEGSGIYKGELSTTNIPVDISKTHNLFENMGSVVVMPQTVNRQPISLKLRVSGGVTSAVDLGTNSTALSWEAGKKYIYTMTLTTETVTFDVNVLDWVDDEVEL